MNKKFLTLSVIILLLALLTFNTHPALSTTPDSTQTTPTQSSLKNLDTIDNSTLPNTLSPIIQTFEEQQLFVDFLNNVVGLDTNNYTIDQLRTTPETIVGSQKTQTSISAILSNNQATLNIAMVIIEGKVRFYDLNIAAGTLKGSPVSVNDYLSVSKNTLNQYRTNFKADYCTELAQLIPTTPQTQEKMSIDNGKLQLAIDCSKETDSQGKCAELIWYQKIGDFTTPTLSIQATFSETGLLTSFADNMGVYKVATTKINLTETDAIDLSLPLINEYADANGRTVESIETEFAYVSDIYSARGDKFLVYPQWAVRATFDNPDKDDIVGYSVLIWGDSGEIRNHGEQGAYQLLQNGISIGSTYQYVIVLMLVMAIASIGVVTYRRAKNTNLKPKYFAFKVGGILIAVSLCTLLIAQPALAAPATILGSTYAINNPTEATYVSNFINDLNNWCSGIGYTTYNWYGSSTTANKIYTAAYDHGEMGSIVFYIGHGSNGAGLPSADYSIIDNDGNWISATDIYNNSSANSVGHRKVAVIWACQQGNTINNMPRAWLHTTSLSSNGYTSPDYSGQAFIGWNLDAPYICVEIDNEPAAGNGFLREFYINALYRGFDLRNSLNLAAQTTWGKSFDNCAFRTGVNPWVSGCGNMVVYGQGTMYIGYTAYANSIYDWDYGKSYASGVFNRNNLLGSQIDGQFAQIYAGNLNDYAFIVSDLGRQASGQIHLQAYSATGYYTHVTVYVSNNGYNWYTTADGYLTVDTPVDVYCGSYSNFRYVGVSVRDDVGWSANLFVDAIHVYTG